MLPTRHIGGSALWLPCQVCLFVPLLLLVLLVLVLLLLLLQALGPEVEDPSSLQCINALSVVGNKNWAAYVDPTTNAPLPFGHLMTYPNWVDAQGNVSELQGCAEFPDLGGKILGQKSNVLPPILTT
jgi:hypothetical protein